MREELEKWHKEISSEEITEEEIAAIRAKLIKPRSDNVIKWRHTHRNL
jgi:uncharacterized protein YqeY